MIPYPLPFTLNLECRILFYEKLQRIWLVFERKVDLSNLTLEVLSKLTRLEIKDIFAKDFFYYFGSMNTCSIKRLLKLQTIHEKHERSKILYLITVSWILKHKIFKRSPPTFYHHHIILLLFDRILKYNCCQGSHHTI